MPTRGEALRRLGCAALFVAGLFAAATTIAGMILTFSPLPYWDQWDDNLDLYIRAQTSFWTSVWSWHTQHRPVLSRLIAWADMRWAGGINIVPLVAIAMFCAIIIGLLMAMATPRRPDRWTRLALLGGIATFVFSWEQVENFTWGFESLWFLCNLFALLALWLLMRARDAPAKTGWLLAAVLCAVLTTLSLGNGLLVFPVMVLAAAYWRIGWGWVAVLAGCCGLIGAVYFADAPFIGDAAGPVAVIRADPVGVIRFVLRYCGAPVWFVWPVPWLDELAGALVCLGVLGGVVLTIRARGVVACPALLLFTLFIGITAVATAAGRLALGPTAALASRYTTNSLLMMLCLLLFLIANLKARAARRAATAVLAAAVLMLTGVQAGALRPDRDVLFARLLAGAALRAGVYDHAFTGSIYPVADWLHIISTAAQARHLSVFGAGIPGLADLPEHVAADRPCVGHVDTMTTTGTPGVLVVEGWIYDDANAAMPANVVFADPAGRPLGFAVIGVTRTDVAAALHLRGRRYGWVGFMKATGGEVRSFGVGGGRPPCVLAQVVTAAR